MKKLIRKVLKKQTQPPDTGGRITNETVAEHRERVLAGGRKFKYPLQYTKHRVLFISIAIVLFTTITITAFSAWQLYLVQSTDKFMYSLTQLVPVPVGSVNGQWVRYSNYLLDLRSAIHYLSTKEAVNFNSDDGKRQLDYQKRLALNKAIQNAIIDQLASQNHINVTSKEIDDFIQQQINNSHLGVNMDVYKQVIRDYYDWSFDEYKISIGQQLLSKKVMAQLDTTSKQKITDTLKYIQQSGDFEGAAKSVSEDVITKAQGGDVGVVSKNADDPNGLIAAVGKLQIGQVSGVIEGVDGFYLVKLIDKPDSSNFHFAKIFIAYKVMDQKLAEYKKQGKIQEFISVNQITQPINQGNQ